MKIQRLIWYSAIAGIILIGISAILGMITSLGIWLGGVPLVVFGIILIIPIPAYYGYKIVNKLLT